MNFYNQSMKCDLNKRRKRFRLVIACVVMLFCFTVTIKAQDTEKIKKWNYLAEMYLMFPSMIGEVGIANLPSVEVDAGAGSIFGNLKMGMMLYLEANTDEWAITSDLLYMKLGQDVVPNQLVTSGEVTMKQTAWEVAGLKRITPWLEAGVGGTLVSLYTGLDLETINDANESGEISRTWFDPIILVRTQGVVKENWLLQFRGNIGGFGVGSDFSWQVQGNVGYKFSELFQTSLGYRYISIDYNKEEFKYDIDTYGWVLRFGFNF